MGKIVAIANQKGGVGKTTTAVNFCACLKQRGRRVLLVDCDAQANATSGMGIAKSGVRGVYDVMLRGMPTRGAVIKTAWGDVLPSSKDLAAANMELVNLQKREYVLKKALEQIESKYEYIIIDCPPALELLTLNTFCAADSVLVPVQCEYYALEGLSDLMTTMKRVRRQLNPRLKLEGILLTMYDNRTKLSDEVAEELQRHFGGKVYRTSIPRNVRLSEAPSYGKPCIAYDKSSKGARAYLHMTSEFLKNQKEGVDKNG